ncbi:MAG: hypothetical protein ACPLTR_03560 [Thermacetogeniaceae bacterium]
MFAEFIIAALAFAGTLAGALTWYLISSGSSDIVFETGAIRDYSVTLNQADHEIRCRCLIPLTNRGRHQGMVVNVFCQPMYYGKIMEKLEINTRLRPVRQSKKETDYWEAIILKKGASLPVELEMMIKYRTDLNEVIREIPWLTAILYYQVIDKRGIRWQLAETRFNLKKLQSKGDEVR